jgi:putative aldouronate transport system substrate-binding protein
MSMMRTDAAERGVSPRANRRRGASLRARLFEFRYVYMIDEAWDSLDVAHRWYQAGHFQSEIEDVGSNATAQSQKRLAAGDFFARGHVSRPGMVPEQSAAWGHPHIGSGPVWQQMVTKNILNGSMDAISVPSDKSVEAIQPVEHMNVDKFFNNLLNFGIEGSHYEFVDRQNGIIRQLAATGIRPTVGFYEDLTKVNTQVSSVDAVRQQYDETLWRDLVDPDSMKKEFQDALVAAGVHDVEREVKSQLDAYFANKKVT